MRSLIPTKGIPKQTDQPVGSLDKTGIRHERITPGKPKQNGRHERFHLTLKEAMTPPEKSKAEQQRRFNSYRRDYNTRRRASSVAQARG